MKTVEIRSKFIEFFESKGHKHLPSSSLVPQDDPTLLFANAGMNQFKDYFTGKANAVNPRAVTSQKCTRAGGKHNDLQNVGFTARHHTFFEMLGNFSFGDYFKKEAIDFAWEFLTKELKISPDKLIISVHDSDDEALKLWKKIGVPANRIFKMGDADNFWEMGDVGPCGPCSEIFYDHGPKFSTKEIKAGENPLLDEGRYVEIWNLVFMQFEQTQEGRNSLPKPSVDTGMGLERLAACMQGVYWNYDTDLFAPVISAIEKVSGADYNKKSDKGSIRVLADHIRASVMLITDGVIPSNEGRGYVLRRIIRRAIRHLDELGLKDISFYKLVPSVFETLGSTFPENHKNGALAENLLKSEELKFRETLEQGLKLLNREIKSLKNDTLSGETAFKLYDTYGFPIDLTEVIVRERNLRLDIQGFEIAMQEQKNRSKQGGKFQVQEDHKKAFYTVLEKYGETIFTGYVDASSVATLKEKITINHHTYLIFDKTPFYGESGGQIGDTGFISSTIDQSVIANVIDTQKPVENLWSHQVSNASASSLNVGEAYRLNVDTQRRNLIKRNHSATHLLQSALTKVLGEHIKQAGSLVTQEKLRFDFTHSQALTNDEIQSINKIINSKIQASLNVTPRVMTKDQAMESGATALFGEKYGDEVRVVSMGEFSTELCGGIHVKNTNEIQYFSILNESSLASGIRRLEALTSTGALDYLSQRSQVLAQAERELGVNQQAIISRIQQLGSDLKVKNKEVSSLNDQLQAIQSKDLFKTIAELSNGIKVSSANLSNKNGGELRKISDTFFNETVGAADNILILTSTDETDKISFIVRKDKSAFKSLNLNLPLKDIFKGIEGRGGGKPDMVQGSADKSKHDLFMSEWIKQLEGINV